MDDVEPVLVMMEGVAGSGKSTLASALADRLTALGHVVDFLPEEAIFNRAEFDAVGRAFRSKNYPTPQLMLSAYKRIFADARRSGASVIADWNALGMIEDLPCAQSDRRSVTSNVPGSVADPTVLRSHAKDVRTSWGGPAALLLLEVPVEVAVARALRERGQPWIDRELRRLGSSSESAAERIARHYAAFDRRRRAIADAYAKERWEVTRLDASQAPDSLHEATFTHLYPDA